MNVRIILIMISKDRNIIFLLLLSILSTFSYGQSLIPSRGTILKQNTVLKIADVKVRNISTNNTVVSDYHGEFKIPVSLGDTLVFNHYLYIEKKIEITSLSDTILYLQASTVLPEVNIAVRSNKQNLQEIEDAYRSKGIYYKGRPPLVLLSPFGGHPITFFNELFSKDAKRARRFHEYATQETAYNEIARSFNDTIIKKITHISDEDLEEFKSKYWPKVEQVRRWNEYELYNYIKISYNKFKDDIGG